MQVQQQQKANEKNKIITKYVFATVIHINLAQIKEKSEKNKDATGNKPAKRPHARRVQTHPRLDAFR